MNKPLIPDHQMDERFSNMPTQADKARAAAVSRFWKAAEGHGLARSESCAIGPIMRMADAADIHARLVLSENVPSDELRERLAACINAAPSNGTVTLQWETAKQILDRITALEQALTECLEVVHHHMATAADSDVPMLQPVVNRARAALNGGPSREQA